VKVDFVNPFVTAAREVLRAEAHCEAERGPLALDTSGTITSEVSAMIAVTGAVRGLVLYTMSQETACNLAAQMIGQTCCELDELAQSPVSVRHFTAGVGDWARRHGLHAGTAPVGGAVPHGTR